MAEYDLKVSGGLIVDGTGAPGYVGDVGVRDGRIVALGAAPGAADEVIDAGGRVVAPGFVDIHTHYDAQLLWDPSLSVSPWHGVTTAVIGNCGFGVAPTRVEHRDLILRTLERVEGMSLPALEAGIGADWPFVSFPEYLDTVERAGCDINIAVLAGHTPIRLFVMGVESVKRQARPDEIARMKALVKEAMEAGALGFATSVAKNHLGFDGNPVPSQLATFAEIRTLCEALGEVGKGVIQYHVGVVPHWEEYEALVAASGRTVCWTGLASGNLGPSEHRNILERTREQQARGLPIFPQGGARPISMEFDMRSPVVFNTWENFRPVHEAPDDAARAALYTNPEFRRRFVSEAAGQGTNDRFFAAGTRERDANLTCWNQTVVSWYPPDPGLHERLLSDIAAERGVTAAELLLDLTIESALEARFRMPRANFDEAGLAEILADPNVVLGLGDGGAHMSQLCDACYPTYLLGYWVRKKKILSLEQAVFRLTGQPADVFGISDRGRLMLNRPADIVVFDSESVDAGPLTRLYDLPAGADRLVSYAQGIEAVVVNGRRLPPIGQRAARGAGRLLRNGAAAA